MIPKNFIRLLLIAYLGFFLAYETAEAESEPKLVVQLGHSASVGPIAFSRDSQFVLSGDYAGEIILWEADTGQEIRTFRVPYKFTSIVAFSPDGHYVLAGDTRGSLILWEAGTGLEVRVFGGLDSGVKASFFSMDGKELTVVDGKGKIITWKVETGNQLMSISIDHPVSTVHPNITAAAFTPDGKYVITGSYHDVMKLSEIATGKQVYRFEGRSYIDDKKYPGSRGELSDSIITSITVSPDGKQMLSSSRQWLNAGEGNQKEKLTLWEMKTGQIAKVLAGPSAMNVDHVSFSPGGKTAASSDRRGNVIFWDIKTGTQIRTIPPQEEIGIRYSRTPRTLAFSADGQHLLSVNDFGMVLLDVSSGINLQKFKGEATDITSADATQKKGTVIFGRSDGKAELWDMNNGLLLKMFSGHPDKIHCVAISPDGKRALTGSSEKPYIFWETETGEIISSSEKENSPPDFAQFNPNGSFLWSINIAGVFFGLEPDSWLWEVKTGSQIRDPDLSYGLPLFSPDGDFAVWIDSNNRGELLELSNGRIVKKFDSIQVASEFPSSVAFSPSGGTVLHGETDGSVILLETKTGNEIRTFTGLHKEITAVAFSPTGNTVLAGDAGGALKLWETETGQEIRAFEETTKKMELVSFIHRGEYIISYHNNKTYRIWDVSNGVLLRTIKGHDIPMKISPDGMYALGFGENNGMVLFELLTGRVIKKKPYESNSFSQFVNNGKFVLSGSQYGDLQILETASGRLIATIFSYPDGIWAIVAPDGRYDSNSPGDLPGLSWLMKDAPLTPVPVEIFMKEYYEPRLLTRLLEGEKFPPLKKISDLNRVQPKVEIISIKPQKGKPGYVSLSLHVEGNQKVFNRDGKTVLQKTGVYDLRVFRDQHLVGYAPQRNGEIFFKPGSKNAIITFDNIRLPRNKDVKRVEFSAYAFNVDGVKSSTIKKEYMIPNSLPPAKGRAYIITVGVNAFSNPAWNLQFASNDAKAIGRALSKQLGKQTDEFEEIITLTLYSENRMSDGKKAISQNLPTKENIKNIFECLSGKSVPLDFLSRIPQADRIRSATPEDLIILSFSSHGYVDDRGTFYIFPYDIGKSSNKEITDDLLSHTISSENLSLWLRDIDAGEMVMIVDACHSAASIETEGFKPGPMGSRGLGQLAYNKGMRILAGTKADDVALESELIRHGVLTYALIHDGLNANQADHEPKDGEIKIGEWLKYGEKRVPKLYAEIKKGSLKNFDLEDSKRGICIVLSDLGRKNRKAKWKGLQQPVLFDFKKGQSDTTLMKIGQ